MFLNNQVSSNFFPLVPENLRKHISVFSTCSLTLHEGQLFSICLQAVEKHLFSTNYVFPANAANCCFLGSGDFSFSYDMTDIYGLRASIIIYPVYLWRAARLNDIQIITCFLEELCHHFYPELDENQITYRVAEVALHASTDLTRARLYPGLQ